MGFLICFGFFFFSLDLVLFFCLAGRSKQMHKILVISLGEKQVPALPQSPEVRQG